MDAGSRGVSHLERSMADTHTPGYSNFIQRAGWSHLPPLSRVALGRRHELDLTLDAVAEAIGPIEALSVAQVRNVVHRFENGGSIDPLLFDRLVGVLNLDPDAVNRLISEHRLEDIRRVEGWTFDAPGMQVVLCFSRSAGVTRRLPSEISTPAAAEEYARALAIERKIRAVLIVQGRVRIGFDRTGRLTDWWIVKPQWSHYPFAGMLDYPPDDEMGGSR